MSKLPPQNSESFRELCRIFSLSLPKKSPSNRSKTNQRLDDIDVNEFDCEAIVEEIILPRKTGRIYFKGTSWPARCKQDITFKPDETVRVTHISNITLFVEPVSQSNSSQTPQA